ncbi:probable cytochrome P450 6d4 [Photinus pyralis]|uniref:probable cytochrome P450 6d4 n=1 Tax=Photinus pyralis TaxID=7054 RepID=UPI0012673742|nr:probable cytochrome P450 6d4 [Photinus pyralis]
MENSTLALYCTLLILIVITIRAYFKSKFQYWKQNGAPYLELRIPFGTIDNPLFETKSVPEILQKQYMESKSKGYKYLGIYAFTSPQLLIFDPEIIKCVLSKGFSHFMERGIFSDEEELLTMHLFSLRASKWRKLRPKLTPTFTSGKMKMMFNTVKACGYQLEKHMGDICAKGPVDIKQLLEYYTAFGID